MLAVSYSCGAAPVARAELAKLAQGLGKHAITTASLKGCGVRMSIEKIIVRDTGHFTVAVAQKCSGRWTSFPIQPRQHGGIFLSLFVRASVRSARGRASRARSKELPTYPTALRRPPAAELPTYPNGYTVRRATYSEKKRNAVLYVLSACGTRRATRWDGVNTPLHTVHMLHLLRSTCCLAAIEASCVPSIPLHA